MAENLFPEEEELTEEEIISDDNSNFKDGYKFSTDFLLDGNRNIISCTAAESWVQWCKKVLKTPRYKCDAYSDDIGIDIDEVFASKTKEEAESILSTEIEEALTADPYNRTAYVESVNCTWITPDTVYVEVSVVGYDGTAETIDATLGGTE